MQLLPANLGRRSPPEGIEGTNLEEVIIPSGRTRSINYNAPSSEGEQKVKCYVPGGSSTVISLRVAAGSAQDSGTGGY